MIVDPHEPQRRCFPALLSLLWLATDCLVGSNLSAQQPRQTTTPKLALLPAAVAEPPDNPTSAAKVALGKQLFFDRRLSGDNTISCATCHLPDRAFADGLPRAQGRGGKILARNTQSLLNVGFAASLFWDGRSSSLEEQALIPIVSPDEMNQQLDALEEELNKIPAYVRQFESVFNTRITRDGIAKALASFQRTLVADAPSAFDRYLGGDERALSASAKEGLRLFREDAGCIRCHNGPLLSDGKFYRLGVSFLDRGRGAVTGNPEDESKFRAPPLRNVAETAPYMHDGSLKTLDDVVMFYYRGVPPTSVDRPLDVEPLLGQSFSEMTSIVAFLRSLSSKLPEVIPPELP